VTSGTAAAIAAQVDGLRTDLVGLRRDLHRHAETAWTEFRTACVIAGRLQALGFDVTLGRRVMVPGARMGVPPPEVIDAACRRARDEGAPAELLYEMEAVS
jgi:aminobenzoyl-glutamate utilization protein A